MATNGYHYFCSVHGRHLSLYILYNMALKLVEFTAIDISNGGLKRKIAFETHYAP